MLKARRLEDEATARRLFEIRQGAPAGFAPVLHCHGAVLLEAWIEGEDLAQRPATTQHLIEAATLLACLHATPLVFGRPLPATQSTAAEREMAEHARRRLAADGRMPLAESDGIGAALKQLDPIEALVGLVHTDFCGENMVIDPDGRLHIIDNERMGLGALGLDVARTWYRWMLPPPGLGMLLRKLSRPDATRGCAAALRVLGPCRDAEKCGFTPAAGSGTCACADRVPAANHG